MDLANFPKGSSNMANNTDAMRGPVKQPKNPHFSIPIYKLRECPEAYSKNSYKNN